jgi:chromosome partitioning protein
MPRAPRSAPGTRCPATGPLQSVTGHSSRAPRIRRPATDHRLPASGPQPPAPRHPRQDTDSASPVTEHTLPVPRRQPRAPGDWRPEPDALRLGTWPQGPGTRIQGPMILSLVSQKGGVGKSSLALAIAWELHARGTRVLLADTDPQATARTAGELAADRGLQGPTTLVFGKDLSRPNQLPALAKQFDHVVIDTPGKLTDVTTPVLMVSDVTLIPIGPSPAELWSNADTITIVQAARESFNPNLRAAIAFVRNDPKTVLSTRVRETLEKGELPVLWFRGGIGRGIRL